MPFKEFVLNSIIILFLMFISCIPLALGWNNFVEFVECFCTVMVGISIARSLTKWILSESNREVN